MTTSSAGVTRDRPARWPGMQPDRPQHPRRTVVAAGAALAAAPALAPLLPSPAAAATRATFRHGVASGDPLPTAVVLWTRVTPVPDAVPGSGRGPRTSVVWEVAEDERFARVVRRGRVRTGPERDHTVKVDARGLDPDRWYAYRFRVGDVVSPVGRTRTAPARGAEVERLRAGLVSCSNWEAGFFAAYGHLADRDDLDLVVHLGDYLYEGGGAGVRAHAPDREIVTTADYRERHGQYKSDPDLQRLHARVPFVVTWDDHEVTNDSWRAGAENHQEDEGDYLARKRRAHRVYDEWMPVRMGRSAETGDGTRLYRGLAWGALADVLMLDLRSYRSQQITTPVPFPLPQVQTEADDPDRTITGRRQMDWLKASLSSSRARWRLVGNSVMVAPLSYGQLPTDAVQAINEVTGDGPQADGATLNLDQWDGYTADRRELFGHVADAGVTDTVFLTGDIHSGWANDLPLDPGTYPLTGTAGVEFVCTSVTSSNIDDVTGAPPRTATLAIEAQLQLANRHVKYVNFDDHGFSVMEVTPEQVHVDFWVVEDRTQPTTPARVDTSWRTLAGSGRVERADGPLA